MTRLQSLFRMLDALDPRLVYGVVALLVVLFAGLDYFLAARFQLGRLGAVVARSAQLKKDILELKDSKNRIQHLSSQRDLLRLEHADLQRMIVSKDGIPVVLDRISSVAGRYGVQVNQILPRPMEDKPLLKRKEGVYFSQRVQVQLRAGYHDFARMLDELMRQGVFWKIDELQITAGESEQRHTIEMILRVLILEK